MPDNQAAEYYRRVILRDEETRGVSSSLSSAGSDGNDGDADAGDGGGGGGAASNADTNEARMFLAAHARDRARYDEAAVRVRNAFNLSSHHITRPICC